MIKEAISGAEIVLVSIDIEKYPEKVAECLRLFNGSSCNKVCYLCLQKSYLDTTNNIRDHGFNMSNFFFVDMSLKSKGLAGHVPDCIFVENIDQIGQIIPILLEVVSSNGCKEIFIDTLSCCLFSHQRSQIMDFVSHLSVALKNESDIQRIVMLALKEDNLLSPDYSLLINDLSMLSDRIISYEKQNVCFLTNN